MDCKITFTRKARSAGMTLMEFMVASAIASMIFLALANLSAYSGRSFAAMANYVDLDRRSREALDLMTTEIRQANKLKYAQPTYLWFEDSDGNDLVYWHDTYRRKLWRWKGGNLKELLDQCEYLKFSTFQRNPVGGTYDQYPVATAGTCKLVQLTWVCSRTILGAKVNTESVLSAKIVIRKQ